MRSHPAKSGETFDGPPTLERSGSERRGGVVSSLFPEGERVGVRGGALFKGKEGRGDFRKEIPLYYFLNTLLKLERCPQNPSVTCENRIYFSALTI